MLHQNITILVSLIKSFSAKLWWSIQWQKHSYKFEGFHATWKHPGIMWKIAYAYLYGPRSKKFTSNEDFLLLSNDKEVFLSTKHISSRKRIKQVKADGVFCQSVRETRSWCRHIIKTQIKVLCRVKVNLCLAIAIVTVLSDNLLLLNVNVIKMHLNHSWLGSQLVGVRYPWGIRHERTYITFTWIGGLRIMSVRLKLGILLTSQCLHLRPVLTA